ncbi:hypothetical protein F4780DRAFT_784038 [Xylariomycetidae sp. FL0641]|nr:hypothetical protein F4780DRAFT_784038 [Xylariomycetidae sp. FL0641]
MAVNAGNESAMVMNLLIALCFLTKEQETTLRQGRDIPPLDLSIGNGYTMMRVNHPPGIEPLTAAPFDLVAPTAMPAWAPVMLGRGRFVRDNEDRIIIEDGGPACTFGPFDVVAQTLLLQEIEKKT